MKAYRITGGYLSGQRALDAYKAIRADAHEAAKLRADRGDVRIEAVEFEVNQAVMCQVLTSGASGATFTVERTWMLTDRGGLKEVPNGE